MMIEHSFFMFFLFSLLFIVRLLVILLAFLVSKSHQEKHLIELSNLNFIYIYHLSFFRYSQII